MRPASALNLNQDSHEAILYLTARAEEDEQGNVHVDESEDVSKEEEYDLDAIMGEVREALTISCTG